MPLEEYEGFYERRLTKQAIEKRIFQEYCEENEMPSLKEFPDLKDLVRCKHFTPTEILRKQILDTIKDSLIDNVSKRNIDSKEPFEFYGPLNHIPTDEWFPATGIKFIQQQFHKGRDTDVQGELDIYGFPMHPRIRQIFALRFPHLLRRVQTWCRPISTSLATFEDFNKEQTPTEPFSMERIEKLIPIVTRLLGAHPFMPLHYLDTFCTKMPLTPGCGYHNRNSYVMKAHAKYFSAPDLYRKKTTSKGYFINAYAERARTQVHNLKYDGWIRKLPHDITSEQFEKERKNFLLKYPTMLFARSHISQRDKLKHRPVYAVDDLFITLENMLTFPLHVQARMPESAIMYGLETIRGGSVYLDKEATKYKSFMCIDWSSYDQTVPWTITDLFFDYFLPKLLIINKGCQPTFEWPNTTQPASTFGKKINNILLFLKWWYKEMIFVSQHGYGYKRTCAGIPSGLLNTQYLDSFANLVIMIDALISFGAKDFEINAMKFHVMGDDNVIYTQWDLPRATEFMDFLTKYAKERFHMVVNRSKSLVTSQRHLISVLSYQINFGKPKRDMIKLIAQLCYPERGVNPKTMSSRAIGIAYATLGHDYDAYKFCEAVYNEFINEAEPATDDNITKNRKLLPGLFRLLDTTPDFLITLEFPTFDQVKSIARHWQGPLDIDSKWDPSHFLVDCTKRQTDYATLYEWRKKY